jgi:hypothetical protein
MNNYYNHYDENYDENVKYSARKVNKNVKLGNLNKFLKSIQATNCRRQSCIQSISCLTIDLH